MAHQHPRFSALHADFLVLDQPGRTLLSEIAGKRIRRGAFKSVDELEAAITDYLGKHNANPKLFRWTATVDSILEKNGRARAALEKVKAGTK